MVIITPTNGARIPMRTVGLFAFRLVVAYAVAGVIVSNYALQMAISLPIAAVCCAGIGGHHRLRAVHQPPTKHPHPLTLAAH